MIIIARKKALNEKYKDKNWLLNQYKNLHKSSLKIAREQKVSKQTILYWLKKHKIETRSLEPLDQRYREKDWIYLQYITNKNSIYKIADMCNTSTPTILTWLEKFGIKRRNSSDYLSNEQNHNWRGDEASSRSKRRWLYKRYPTPSKCQNCGELKDIDLSFNHKLGDHTRNIKDYEWLCRKCHVLRDIEEFGLHDILVKKKSVDDILEANGL